jgi:uncharacterized cupin superfamily protein
MHRTETVDYVIVVDGEMCLVLDDTEVVPRAGDGVVQRGTNHAWANRSDQVARLVFVMVDGEYAPELAEVLGAEALARMARETGRDMTGLA